MTDVVWFNDQWQRGIHNGFSLRRDLINLPIQRDSNSLVIESPTNLHSRPSMEYPPMVSP